MDYQAWLKSQEEAADLSSISWLLNPPLNCNIHQSDTFEVVAVSLPTSIGSVRGPCTSGDMTNTGHTVLCDDSNFVALRPDGLGNDHVCRVSFVYWVLLGQSPWHECGSRCPKVRDVWLRMIEGDGSGDDVWLWVDGDEEWIRRNASEWFFPPKLEEEDWVAAQSALGRRLDRTRLTSSPASPKTANLTLENQRTNACLREATPAQRVAAMYWLIQTSTRKEELDFQLGLSSRWKFSLGGLIRNWSSNTSEPHLSVSFPEQPEAWKRFREKREVIGCDCLDEWELHGMIPKWFTMMMWLRPEWNLEVDCLRPRHCSACKSRGEELYNRIYDIPHSRDTLPVPIHLTFSLLPLDIFYRYSSTPASTVISFAKAVASKSLTPNAQREADERHYTRFGPGERDILCSPWVNACPNVVQKVLVRYSCEVGPSSQPVPETLENEDLDELPVGFADEAPNLMVFVGTIMWILACRFTTHPDWHSTWAVAISHLLELREVLPLPELAGIHLELRNQLKRLNSVARGQCFSWPQHDDTWTIYSAIMMHVKNLNLGPKFNGCSNCHTAYLTVVGGSGSGTETTRSGRFPVLEKIPSPPQVLVRGSDSIGHTDQAASSELASSPLRSQNPGSAESTVAEVDFWALLRDKSLAPAYRQRTFDVEIRKLITLASATGVRFPIEYIPPADLSEGWLTLPAYPSVEIGADDEQRAPARLTQSTDIHKFSEVIRGQQMPAPTTQLSDAMTSTFDSAPNVDLRKCHKIADIRRILIEMLCEIGFPIRKNRLPWFTLEDELNKHGYAIINWPIDVPRENDRGVYSLNAASIDKLYFAIARAREEDRLGFVKRANGSTDPRGEPVLSAGSSKRRLAIDHYDGEGKRTRFKMTTPSCYAGSGTDC